MLLGGNLVHVGVVLVVTFGTAVYVSEACAFRVRCSGFCSGVGV